MCLIFGLPNPEMLENICKGKMQIENKERFLEISDYWVLKKNNTKAAEIFRKIFPGSFFRSKISMFKNVKLNFWYAHL